MYNTRYSNLSSSTSSSDSNQQNLPNNFKPPNANDYEYLGRLVTRERPITRKFNPIQKNFSFPRSTQNYQHSMASHRHKVYEDAPATSSDEDFDDPDGLSKPVGVIRITDRHFREIYRLPTPPPKIKRVYHRLRSPEPKIIERVYVRRPPPQIIENVIEVPPEKVRIIKREKFLDKGEPVTRSKLVHLKSRRQQQREELEAQQYQQQEQTFIPSEQYSEQYSEQQETTIPNTASQHNTTLVYPPQPNMRTVGYIKSTVPPHIMFNSQQPLQITPQQLSNQQMVQPTPYTYPSQQPANTQTIQPTPYTYPSQQPASTQMIQPTPYTYAPQQSIPNSSYGFTPY